MPIMKRHMNHVMTHEADRIAQRCGLAASLALFQAAPKTKAKLSGPDYAMRFAVEKLLLQKRYCNAFELWRTCRNKACRRHGACCGDAKACLKAALPRVPHDVQWRARQNILAATPHNIGAPERQARQCMPIDLYEADKGVRR
jgi:hypothetical protein